MAISTPVGCFTEITKCFMGLYISIFHFVVFFVRPKHPFRVRPLLRAKCISGRISGKLGHFPHALSRLDRPTDHNATISAYINGNIFHRRERMEEYQVLAQLAKSSINVFHLHQTDTDWVVEYEYKWGEPSKPKWSKATYVAPKGLQSRQLYIHLLAEVNNIRDELGRADDER